MPQLTERERREFLDAPGVLMRIAVVRDTGAPLVTPIWHQRYYGAGTKLKRDS